MIVTRVKENGTLLNTILDRKEDWIGYIVKGKGMLTVVFKSTFKNVIKRGDRKKEFEVDIGCVKRGGYKRIKERL